MDSLTRQVTPLPADWRATTPFDVAAARDERTVPTSTDELAIYPGSFVGHFQIVERVGEGGMGVVFSAYDPDLDRRVALKVLRMAARSDESVAAGRERLLREARALAKLSHPNVIAVHDVGTSSDGVFLAMELADRGTMRDWLAQAPRPWREVLARFVAAGRGLAAAHDAGLVHRDFKPDNVLVVDGGVRVGDFGLVSAGEAPGPASGAMGSDDGPLTQEGAVLGTPGYMAPEQVRGEHAGPAADQFAFCVTLWEALYGARPFPRSRSKLIEAVERGPAQPPATDVPDRVRQALERGLRLDAAQRWPSMHDLLCALERTALTCKVGRRPRR